MDWIDEPWIKRSNKYRLAKRPSKPSKPSKLTRRPQPLRFYESDEPVPYECFMCGYCTCCCRCQDRETEGIGSTGSTSYYYIEKNGYRTLWTEGLEKPLLTDVNAPFPYELLEGLQTMK